MMKRIRVGIIIILICMIAMSGCNNMKFDQKANKNDLLTIQYQNSQIEKLQSEIAVDEMTFSNFKRVFDVQCIRKTHQGYYVVLMLEDGRYAFVFFNKKNILVRVMVVDDFKSKIEFQKQVVEQMHKSEVLNWDSNTIIAPISAAEITVHIVQEGIFIVKYSRFRDGVIMEDPIITAIQFIENDSISTSEDPFIREVVPFVFDFDKTR